MHTDSKVQSMVDLHGQDLTSIYVGIHGEYGVIQELKIIYLVIPSAYSSNIRVFDAYKEIRISASTIYAYFLNPSTTLTQVQLYAVPLTAGSYQIVGFLNAFSFTASNTASSIIRLSLGVSYINTTHYSISIYTLCSDQILLQGYYVSIIVFRSPSTLYGIQITTLTLSNTNSINDASIYPGKTFFGLTQFSYQNLNLQFYIDVVNQMARKFVSSDMLSFTVQIISFEVGICCHSTPWIDASNAFCTDSCLARQYLNSTIQSCQLCLYDCLSCDNSSACTSCSLTTDFRQLNLTTLRCDPIYGYYDPGTTVALSCSYPNCCGYTPAIYNEGATCLVTCPSGFAENSTTRICLVCGPGYWPISRHCINVIGCVSAIIQNNNVICIFCRVTDNFFLMNQSCFCRQGYSLDRRTGKCLEVCGDGIHILQKCDDNNTDDGDGCSSTCQIEDYFFCRSSSSSTASQCTYIGPLQLIYKTARKTLGKNQGVFTFGFSAKYAKLSPAKIVSSFMFTCDPLISSTKLSATSTEVIIIVDYQEDLEGRLGNVTFGMNPKAVLSSASLSTSFLMVSSNPKLIYLRNYPVILSLNKTIQVIALACLATFAVASFAYRVIAVELMHSFLLIYLVFLKTNNLTESYLAFQNLRILAINFQAASSYSQGSGLSYSFQDQLMSKQILFLLLLAPLTIIAVEKIVREFMKDNEGKLPIRYSKNSRYFKYAFMSLMFSLSIGEGFQVLMLRFLSSSSNSQQYFYQATAVKLFLAFCFSLLIFREYAATVQHNKYTNGSNILEAKQYFKIYLSFWLSLMIFLVTCSIFKKGFLLQVSLVSVLIFFVWFICTLPYKYSIHNIGQSINLATDVVFLSWSTGRKYSSTLTDEYIEACLSLALVGLMSASIILSIIRTVHFIRLSCQSSARSAIHTAGDSKDVEDMIDTQCKKLERGLAMKNKYLIRSIMLNEQLLQINGCLNHKSHAQGKKEILLSLRHKYRFQDIRQADNCNNGEHVDISS